MMTNQEAFDYVAKALIAQGKKSVNGRSCVYRSPDGCKCAAGHLITDEEYRPEFDTPTAIVATDIFSIISRYGELENIKESNVYFIRDLQLAHDNADEDSFILDFKRNMKSIAKRYNLNSAALD